MVSAFVLLGREPGGVGRTIRWVDLVDCPVPGRLGFSPVVLVRGMGIGCVVAVPADLTEAGIKPVGCGGLTEGKEPVPGGA
jgi:hypothetical protein